MQTEQDMQLSLSDRAVRLKQELIVADDKRAANQIDDLIQRTARASVLVALVGLFSAGKSTLINALCQSELATGAIPTTATIAEVTVPETGGSVHLLDTPGVDSTDDAHRQATEEALYKADVVLLVMDYQHVEADENLELASGFAAGAKRLVLVVNQVDKHLDFELPFEVFQARVESTLKDWDIPYEQIFYTSTRPSVHSQLGELKTWLSALADDGPGASAGAEGALGDRVGEVIRDHVWRRFHATFEQLVEAAEGVFDSDVLRDEAARTQTLQSLAAERAGLFQSLEASREALEENFGEVRVRFSRMVDLAQIAPYDTTERGRLYVESLRDGFRVGWLGSTAKTEAERNQRLSAFLGDLNDRTLRFLCWAVHGELRTLIQEHAWITEDWLSRVEELTVAADADLCMSVLNRGALNSDPYSYQFVKDVVARMKAQFSSRLSAFLEDLLAAARSNWQTQHAEILRQLNMLDEKISRLEGFVALATEQQQEVERLETVWGPQHNG